MIVPKALNDIYMSLSFRDILVLSRYVSPNNQLSMLQQYGMNEFTGYALVTFRSIFISVKAITNRISNNILETKTQIFHIVLNSKKVLHFV